jgi:hypothetical protein
VLPIVKDNVGFMQGRMLLRSAEGEKVNAGGKKFGLGSLGLSGGGLFKSSKKDPLEQIAEMEENVFQKDPFNIGTGNPALRAGDEDALPGAGRLCPGDHAHGALGEHQEHAQARGALHGA